MKKLLILVALFFYSYSYSQSVLWMRYPAISPDGQTIAFEYKGDIYTVPVSGGSASPLTIHEAYDFMPVWSPDGRNIAFASDRSGNFDVYLISANGGVPKRLTYYSNGEYPSCFTPDGQNVIFSGVRMDLNTSMSFPTGALPELYSVSIDGGPVKQILSAACEDAVMDKSGNRILFHDKKGYEDKWRKHQASSFARDLWCYDKTNESFTKLTDFAGEDRTPVFSPDENTVYFLSERSGTFNVWKMDFRNPSNTTQITFFENNPVRFLTISKDGMLCFAYDGKLYTMRDGGQPSEVSVRVNLEEKSNAESMMSFSNGATEMDPSPNGKEFVFIVRGEVFVASMESGLTKRITNTPGQERSVSFSPDGKSILYASERDSVWGIYQTTIARPEESYFFNSTLLKEEPVVVNGKESFFPRYSPDGKEVAYLEERTAVNIVNLETKAIRNILPADRNYSYSDGDQWFDWSPDSKWLLVSYLDPNQWQTQIGLADASGKEPIIQLTHTGYDNFNQKFMMGGKMMMYLSTENGLRSAANWGAQSDIYAMFFNQEDFDRFKLNKEEYQLLKEKEEKEKKEKQDNKEEVKDESIKYNLDYIDDRKVRLTNFSSEISDAVISPDGERVFYLTKFEGGYDLWMRKIRENETKTLAKLGGNGGGLMMDKDGKNIYVISDGNISKVNPESGEVKRLGFNAEMNLNEQAERQYIFEHIWRQVVKKFYKTDLHGVKWDYYKKEYAKFLPYINNGRDFAEMCSEMLGELNASHTGCRYNSRNNNGDQTAELGVFYDQSYSGKGMKIIEVIERGPLQNASTKIKSGTIIEKVDGAEITNEYPLDRLLNRKSGKYTLLSLYNESTGDRWDETVKPISTGEQFELLYKRWIKLEQKLTDSLSNGRLGYVHVRSMSDPSFRDVFDKVIGEYQGKEGLVVDTRFNGGGNLHDQLAVFLSGRKYFEFLPRGQRIGYVPYSRWIKPSAVIMNEGNYSDAHLFPVAYKELNIGKTIGMPVPGTGTSVWWETLQNPSFVFGIPEVGYRLSNGTLTENQQLDPDYMVFNQYDLLAKGRDQQLEKAVDVLLGR
ncbi:MAG: PD40 domain-containing protein [Bacteroidetes bacterium]|nr:PD40 domain-containing protein [Bacteroidota bacterium]